MGKIYLSSDEKLNLRFIEKEILRKKFDIECYSSSQFHLYL